MVWTGIALKHDTTCAHCGADILGIDTEIQNDHAHSAVIVVQKITPDGYQFYQCVSDQRVHRHNWNFWHCSKDHMLKALPKHIDMKVVETGFAPPQPGNIVNLHLVLEDGLQCEQCGKALVDEAYRITVTYATPIAYIAHNATDEEGWCCSLAHAKLHATTMVALI